MMVKLLLVHKNEEFSAHPHPHLSPAQAGDILPRKRERGFNGNAA